MNLIETLFSGPLLIPSLMLATASLWGLIAIFFGFDTDGGSAIDHAGGGLDHATGGALDHAAGHPSIDGSVDASHATGDVAHHGEPTIASGHGGIFAALSQWLNIREMPLTFWMAAFSIVWWTISIVWWLVVDKWIWTEGVGVGWSIVLMLRNLICTLPLTKVATIPLKGWENSTHLDARSLIGRECVISSSEATPNFGQVKFKTDGAPLLLNVRTDGSFLAKGARVWITHYDDKKRIYQVSPIEQPRISPP